MQTSLPCDETARHDASPSSVALETTPNEASPPLGAQGDDTARKLEALNQQLEVAVLAANELAVRAERDAQAKNILLAALPSILISVNVKGQITQWNRAAEEAFGIASADAIGRSFCGYGILRNCPAIWERISECILQGCPIRLDDVRFTRADGEEGVLGITATPLPDESEAEKGVLLLAADITQRKVLQSQLAQTQKLESIGQLAAGIAHEINTPTQYIGDNTRFLQEAFQDLRRLHERYGDRLRVGQTDTFTPELAHELAQAMEKADVAYLMEEIPRAIEQSLEGIERVSKIVQAMKEFSHPGVAEKVALDINHAIENTLTVARNEWKYVAEVITDFDPALPPVLCLPHDFNQVLLNLIVNAAHAITDAIGTEGNGEKGTITLRTRQEEEWVEIRISDTGGGIPEAIRSKVFDLFFTTKEVGKGSGQGLAIAHTIIVEKHGGTIHFETEEDRGTTFILRLPLETEKAYGKEAA